MKRNAFIIRYVIYFLASVVLLFHAFVGTRSGSLSFLLAVFGSVLIAIAAGAFMYGKNRMAGILTITGLTFHLKELGQSFLLISSEVPVSPHENLQTLFSATYFGIAFCVVMLYVLSIRLLWRSVDETSEPALDYRLKLVLFLAPVLVQLAFMLYIQY